MCDPHREENGMTLWANVLKRMKLIKEMKQQSGSILVISAMMLPLMLGCLGFAYDFGNLYIHKTRLQNIADAAALAGGRAYLESQENPDSEDRDKVDPLPVQPGGIPAEGREHEAYQVGDSKTRYGLHPYADRAADDYIYKNIINLGTTVYNDEFSHYALKSEGASTDGSPRVFYRIGLYEEVPLYFLPLILNKKEQRVRAGAVVLIDDGKGLAAGKSLFDNLFTVKEGLSLANGSTVSSEDAGALNKKPSEEGAATIQATFDGNIVVANKSNEEWTWNNAEKGDYFYTQEEKEYQLSKDLSINEMKKTPNMGGKAVLDNSIEIDANVSNFLKKLTEPHVDLKKSCKVIDLPQPIPTSRLNRFSSGQDAYITSHYTISTQGDVTNYYHKYFKKVDNTNVYIYVSCIPPGKPYPRVDNYPEALLGEELPGEAYEPIDGVGGEEIYYYFYTEGYQFLKAGSTSKIECFTYVLDSDGNKIFCDRRIKNNDNYYKKYFFDFYKKKAIAQDPTVYEYRLIAQNDLKAYDPVVTDDSITFYYNDNGSKKSFTIYKKKDINLTAGRTVNNNQIFHSNIFHLEQDGWEEKEEKKYDLKIDVDSLPGEDYNPLYLIITGNKGKSIKINVTGSNDRPLVICNLTSNDISEFSIVDGKTFKGMIYSPYSKVVNIPPVTGSSGRRFVGNIIAKSLDIQDAGTTWTHQNFVEGDSELNAVSDEAAEKQEKRKQNAINFAIRELGISSNDWYDSDWFGKQDDTKKEQIIRAWNAARQKLWSTEGLSTALTDEEDVSDYEGLDMPDWPWKEGGKTTDPNMHHYSVSNSEGIAKGETLRLINFRTEYTIEPYINPFNNLYLRGDD